MHDLQAEMHTKRRESYEQEDRLGTDNPPVFATVQTSRPTQLEQTKHCLVLHKKACRWVCWLGKTLVVTGVSVTRITGC